MLVSLSDAARAQRTGCSSMFQPFIGHIADRFDVRLFFILAPTVMAVMMSLIGADGYAPDAASAVDISRSFVA